MPDLFCITPAANVLCEGLHTVSGEIHISPRLVLCASASASANKKRYNSFKILSHHANSIYMYLSRLEHRYFSSAYIPKTPECLNARLQTSLAAGKINEVVPTAAMTAIATHDVQKARDTLPTQLLRSLIDPPRPHPEKRGAATSSMMTLSTPLLILFLGLRSTQI